MAANTSEHAMKATNRYKKNNITQVNISFQKSSGYKEQFKEQAALHGVSINRYVLDMLEQDAAGNLVIIPEVTEGDLPGIMTALNGKKEIRPAVKAVLQSLSDETTAALSTISSSPDKEPGKLIEKIISLGTNEYTLGIAKLLLKCIGAAGGDPGELLTALSQNGIMLRPEIR